MKWLVLLFLTQPVMAQLVVLHQGQHVSRYQAKSVLLQRPEVIPHNGTQGFVPSSSSLLSPGKLSTHTFNPPLSLPVSFFLVGNDAFSRTWLRNHASILSAMDAVGYCVQCPNETDLNDLTRLYPSLSAISGDAFAEQLNITHYPVLITREGYSQ